jgi:hypothetical protein
MELNLVEIQKIISCGFSVSRFSKFGKRAYYKPEVCLDQ